MSDVKPAVEIRPGPDPTTIDEIVGIGIDFHIEQMHDDLYWFCLTKGEHEWHFWLSSNSTIRLSCSETPTLSPSESDNPPKVAG